MAKISSEQEGGHALCRKSIYMFYIYIKQKGVTNIKITANNERQLLSVQGWFSPEYSSV
jgi:hypothetical protein